MPRLNTWTEQCVFFLYRIHPETGAVDGPGGSGFIISRPSQDDVFEHYYAVTNWHVAKDFGYSIIRLNTLDGKTRLIEFDPDQWRHMPGADDLAAVDITDSLDILIDDVNYVPESHFVDRAFIEKVELGLGEDVFMLGMFADSPGKDRNLPAARFGNISRIADNRAPVKQPNDAYRPCHLIDMRSRTGFSGSPVFVYRTPNADLTELDEANEWTLNTVNNLFLRLLGVQCGQFPETIDVATAEARGAPIKEGDKIQSPSAMNIVVPASSISALLDQPDFETIRMERDRTRKPEATKIARPEAVLEPPTTAENPDHQEDFNRLLHAAVPENKSDH